MGEIFRILIYFYILFILLIFDFFYGNLQIIMIDYKIIE